MTRDDAIDRFLAAVSDRCEADWAELEQMSTSAEDHALVQNLRALRTIAEHGAPLSRAEADAPKGTWAHLTLLEKIGEGAYGEVHRAWDPKLSIDVALKLIPSQLTSPDEALREGRMLARIRHDNVARVFGVDHQGGFVGIWTEFVDGVTLKDVVREAAPLPEARLLSTARQLLEALAAIHDAHILHRDLKPENVLGRSGRWRRFPDAARCARRGTDRRAQLAGTPRFWAPDSSGTARPAGLLRARRSSSCSRPANTPWRPPTCLGFRPRMRRGNVDV
jgi:serine/threonine protein kinase